jgi:hypothetical protein
MPSIDAVPKCISSRLAKFLAKRPMDCENFACNTGLASPSAGDLRL